MLIRRLRGLLHPPIAGGIPVACGGDSGGHRRRFLVFLVSLERGGEGEEHGIKIKARGWLDLRDRRQTGRLIQGVRVGNYLAEVRLGGDPTVDSRSVGSSEDVGEVPSSFGRPQLAGGGGELRSPELLCALMVDAGGGFNPQISFRAFVEGVMVKLWGLGSPPEVVGVESIWVGKLVVAGALTSNSDRRSLGIYVGSSRLLLLSLVKSCVALVLSFASINSLLKFSPFPPKILTNSSPFAITLLSLGS